MLPAPAAYEKLQVSYVGEESVADSNHIFYRFEMSHKWTASYTTVELWSSVQQSRAANQSSQAAASRLLNLRERVLMRIASARVSGRESGGSW